MVQLKLDDLSINLYSDEAPKPTFTTCSKATIGRERKNDELLDLFLVGVQWKAAPDNSAQLEPLIEFSIPDALDPESTKKWGQVNQGLGKLLQDYAELILKGHIVEMPPDREAAGGNFEINLKPGAEPPNQPPQRLGLHLQPELEKQLKDLLARGYIQHSNSAFGAPVLFVKKKDGSWRMHAHMCVDYRELNDLTVKMKYPLPRADDLLDSLNGATVFTSLDAVQGYHQCRVKLDVLHKNNIQLAPHKCRFGVAEVEFLGHIVSAKGIRPDPKKVSAINEWTAPSNVTGLKSFTGAVNFHRRHIEHCASIMAPLNRLTKKDTPYIRGPEQQAAFEELKDALINAPVLRAPVYGGMFYLYADASGIGMGGALYQDFADGRHPIAFWSRCYTLAENNYSVPDQELCAVVHALKYFEHCVKNAQVTVLSDHLGHATFLSKKGIKETYRHIRWKDF